MVQRLKRLPASACSAGDLGSIPGSGRSPGGENDNPLQYSCLGDPMDRGAWWATVHRVAELGTTERLTHARTALHCSMWASELWHVNSYLQHDVGSSSLTRD